jgi:hypothetical protein
MGTGSFPEVKRPGRGADPHTPSKCRGHERVGLYLYSPSGSSWPVMGAPLPLTLYIYICIYTVLCRSGYPLRIFITKGFRMKYKTFKIGTPVLDPMFLFFVLFELWRRVSEVLRCSFKIISEKDRPLAVCFEHDGELWVFTKEGNYMSSWVTVGTRWLIAFDAPDVTLHCLILLFYILLKMDSMSVKKTPRLLGRVSAL